MLETNALELLLLYDLLLYIALAEGRASGVGVHAVGEVCAKSGLCFDTPDGTERPIHSKNGDICYVCHVRWRGG